MDWRWSGGGRAAEEGRNDRMERTGGEGVMGALVPKTKRIDEGHDDWGWFDIGKCGGKLQRRKGGRSEVKMQNGTEERGKVQN